MKDINGTFVRGADAYGRFFEVFIDGHGMVVGNDPEPVGKRTRRPGASAYPPLCGQIRDAGIYRGSSPTISGFARPGRKSGRSCYS